MSKYPSQIKNLPKWDQKKYFSHELGAGKGDCQRESTPTTRENFSKGFDRINWSKQHV